MATTTKTPVLRPRTAIHNPPYDQQRNTTTGSTTDLRWVQVLLVEYRLPVSVLDNQEIKVNLSFSQYSRLPVLSLEYR
jgi:hypothetical protein